MLFIRSEITNPYFNIASEEYFLKNFTEDFFIIYRNTPAVIIGKHQNPAKEVNQQFIFNKNIPIIRRISGGGTVYHDLGNINFSFILNGINEKLIDFKKYTLPIVNFLKSINLNAYFGERNNIFIDNKKISGNAEHIYKSRVLHHGTLLFNTKLNNLTESIHTNKKIYIDKAVNSIGWTVTNISSYLPAKTEINEFINKLSENISDKFQAKEYNLNSKDIDQISNLVKSKYITSEWNLSYSPKYELINNFTINDKKAEIYIRVETGKIQDIELSGDIISDDLKLKIIKECINKEHTFSKIFHIFNSINISEPKKSEILKNFF